MSGGDCTNEGLYASPVQMSYLMKQGEIVGRLPEFGMSCSLFDAFGGGFIGVSTDRLAGSRLAVFMIDITD